MADYSLVHRGPYPLIKVMYRKWCGNIIADKHWNTSKRESGTNFDESESGFQCQMQTKQVVQR